MRGDATGVTQRHAPLEAWLDAEGVPYRIVEPEAGAGEMLPLDCQRCTWLRRKALFTAAAELGCNVVAFAHHADDAAQTTLLNLLYGGERVRWRPRRLLRRPFPADPALALCARERAGGPGPRGRVPAAAAGLPALGPLRPPGDRPDAQAPGARLPDARQDEPDSRRAKNGRSRPTNLEQRDTLVAIRLTELDQRSILSGAGVGTPAQSKGAKQTYQHKETRRTFMREFAIAAARRAGEILVEFQQRGLGAEEIHTKRSHMDLVTAADLASEKLITDLIRAQYPDHSIYAEESAHGRPPAVEWLWLIDPVDGTTNFAHGVPIYGVNIALAHHGAPVLGVTHDPSSGRTYWAERGGGAWLRADGGDRRLHVSSTGDLRHCLLATGFPVSRGTNSDNNLAEFSALDVQSQAVRRMGSAALHLAWVAAGILDAYWEPSLHPWDWAPGWLLVTEAAGQVTDYAGNPWHLGSRNLIASNGRPGVHRAIVDAIAAARAAQGFAA